MLPDLSYIVLNNDNDAQNEWRGTMNKFEFLFRRADFSKYSDLQSRLGEQLFKEKKSGKTVPFPFTALSDEETAFVNAAQGLPGKTEKPDDPLNQ